MEFDKKKIKKDLEVRGTVPPGISNKRGRDSLRAPYRGPMCVLLEVSRNLNLLHKKDNTGTS